MKNFLSLLLVTSALQFSATLSQAADSLEGIGDLPGGGINSPSYGVSDNGIVVGSSGSSNGFIEAYKWTQGGGITGLGIFFGEPSSSATGITPDGSIIIGYNGGQAVYWQANGTLVPLGYLPGGSPSSSAQGVNVDGSVIVGFSRNSGGNSEAFRWENGVMTGLGDFAGGSFLSDAKGVSGDGTIVVGYGTKASGSEAFRWTAGSGMVGIGFAPGDDTSYANAISRDGSTIVGGSRNSTTFVRQAFKYTVGGGMVGLGSLGGTNAYAAAVNADGSVIVGTATVSGVANAFVWTEPLGMVTLSDLLMTNGVDLTNWTLGDAYGVNGAGDVVVGRGRISGVNTGFIANITTGGITTPEDLGTSLNTVAQASQQASAQAMQYVPQGLFAAQNISSISTPISGGYAFRNPEQITPAAGDYETLLSAFMLGSYGIGANNDFKNDQWNGTIGMTAEIAKGLDIGAGFIAGTSRQELDFEGNSDLDALGGLALLSFEPNENGFRMYATAYATDLKLEIKRGYTNGAGLDSSLGKTDGVSYGTAVKLGWEEELMYGLSTMPYIEGRYAKTKIDSYEEQGGAFAASFSKQDSNYAASRMGIEFDYTATEDLELMLRPAWGRRLTGDNGSFTADVSGLTQSLSSDAGDRNWVELTLGAKYQATDDVKFTTELTGRSGDTAEPAAALMIGSSIRF